MVYVAGHFGEWLQGRQGPAGPVVLITVPCASVGVRAQRRDALGFSVRQEPKILSDDQIATLGTLLDLRQGDYALRAEMPPGGGAGASTAALVALARAAGADETEIASACLAAEGACDPLMLARPDTVLWAPRAARIVRPLRPPPAAEIIGGFLGAPIRTDPNDHEFPDCSALLGAWTQAGNLTGFAQIASASAEACTELRGPTADPMADLARMTGALGHLRAHTGSARGLIFAPGCAPDDVEAVLSQAGLTGLLRFRTLATGSHSAAHGGAA